MIANNPQRAKYLRNLYFLRYSYIQLQKIHAFNSLINLKAGDFQKAPAKCLKRQEDMYEEKNQKL